MPCFFNYCANINKSTVSLFNQVDKKQSSKVTNWEYCIIRWKNSFYCIIWLYVEHYQVLILDIKMFGVLHYFALLAFVFPTYTHFIKSQIFLPYISRICLNLVWYKAKMLSKNVLTIGEKWQKVMLVYDCIYQNNFPLKIIKILLFLLLMCK